MHFNPRPPLQARAAVRGLLDSEIRKVSDPAMSKSGVLPFWFGESDQPTPAFIRQAASDSILRGETFYAQNLGRPWLRAGIAAYLNRLHGRADFCAEQIAVTPSGITALMIAMQCLLSPGDRVLAVTPLWPNLVEIPKILGASVQRMPLHVRPGKDGGGAWALDVGQLLERLTPDVRLLVLNAPNNPTGWMLPLEDLQAILAHCRRHGIWILSDDVYERLVFDAALPSAPTFLRMAHREERLISANSLSKAWSMTGWRVGWLAMPQALEGEVAKLMEYNASCLFDPVQRAALAALEQGEAEVAALRERLRRTRRLLLDGLARLPGVQVPQAGGAMYAFFRIAGHEDSLQLATRLVQEAGLGLAPGTAFGPEGRGWLRWCHNVEEEKLHQGLARLASFLDGRTSAWGT